MRAILINPQDCTITEVDYTGEYSNIYTHIEAQCFDCVRFGDKQGNTIFVDDEGLLNGKVSDVGMFRVDGDFPAYLAGKGLILATDAEGESVATDMDIEELRKKIAFGRPVRYMGEAVFMEYKDGVPTGKAWGMDR